jgi:hypothetical protein
MELDGQKITDKVTELLYMLDEEGNEFAAAVLKAVSLVWPLLVRRVDILHLVPVVEASAACHPVALPR